MEYLFEQPVHGAVSKEKYKITISWRNGTFISDEPVKSGGKDLGPDPYTLLLSALASCTLATLRMYIDRKGWDIADIEVSVNMYQTIVAGNMETTIDRDIRFVSFVTSEQRTRLKEIAANCPVSKILQSDIKVRTFSYNDEDVEKKINYSNDDVSVIWKPELCQHSARCVSGLPKVFDVNAKPWINVAGAPAQKIMEQVKKCPTGALSILAMEVTQSGADDAVVK
jgi:putative redox protein